MIQLDRRLEQVAKLVRPGRTVADIGTDHGYLVAHLVGSGKNPRGLACDINAMPLERARQTILREGLAQQILCVLSNGLEQVDPQAAQEIVIAGMGGDSIADILAEAPWVQTPEHHLVLQPMTKGEHLRRYLLTEGFAIREEQAVASGNFVYTVISAEYTGEKATPSLEALYLGKVQEGGSADTSAYVEQVIKYLQQRVTGMEQGARPAPELEEYRRLLAALEGAKI